MLMLDSFSDAQCVHADERGPSRQDFMGSGQQLEALARCEELTGLSFSVIDSETGQFSSGLCHELLSRRATGILLGLQKAPVHVQDESGLIFYGMRVPGTKIFAGGVLVGQSAAITPLESAATEAGLSPVTFLNWLRRHSQIRPDVARRLLDNARAIMLQQQVGVESVRTREAVGGQLGQVYEEVTLVHDLAQYLRPDVEPLALAEVVLERVQWMTGTELGAICMQHGGTVSEVMRGSWGMEAAELVAFLRSQLGERSPQVLVRNHLKTHSVNGPSRLRCLVAIPLFLEDLQPSWIVLANTADGRELGTEEANLLKSIGGILAAQLRVFELFRDQDTMVLAFIRSLVATLDAKDSYTSGHSERVALVAERIAKQMNLSEREILAIFQAGLLHDLGKIGVSDALLLKRGTLSAEEYALVAKHPEVGYEILGELKGLMHLLPGVRHHHERFDGLGYPDRLAGKAIPRMARILAVADAFDAMGSDRPYRSGKPPEDIEQILSEGAGTQWDPEVIQAYFDVRLDIHRIWSLATERQARESTLRSLKARTSRPEADHRTVDPTQSALESLAQFTNGCAGQV